MSKTENSRNKDKGQQKPDSTNGGRPGYAAVKDPRFSANRIFLWVIFLGSIFGSMAVMAYLRLPPSKAPVLPYEVVNTFAHDEKAFTQGLLIDNGRMIEGTGRFKESSLRLIDAATGNVEKKISLPDSYFGEGITVYGSKIYQLTFQNQKVLIYDKDSLELLEEKRFPYEGWGLTSDSDYLIHSDGSSTIRYLDPETLEVQNKITVRDGKREISDLNELEYYDGRIYANVWQEDYILQIIPATGRVSGRIELTGILDPPTNASGACLNGIAVDPETNTFYVTGKLWPKMFEIRILPPK